MHRLTPILLVLFSLSGCVASVVIKPVEGKDIQNLANKGKYKVNPIV
jgi:hypothetical protein